MEEHLKILYEVFNAEGVDAEWRKSDDFTVKHLQKIYNELGISLKPKTNPMEIILNHIYVNDNISLLARMLGAENDADNKEFEDGISNEFESEEFTSLCFSEFERGDWTEEGEARDQVEDTYGEEGYNYYEIHTKNYIHTFSHMMPFRENFTLCKSDKKNKN